MVRLLDNQIDFFLSWDRVEDWRRETSGGIDDVDDNGEDDDDDNDDVDEARADPSDGGVAPRLQTFLPIISAWAHSRDRNWPQNVQEWIERLEKLSGGGQCRS